MKRFARIVCGLSMGLMLAACGSPAQQSTTAQSTPQENTSQASDSSSGQTSAASATSATSATNVDEKQFVGEWHLASLAYGDAVITGDFSDQYGTPEGSTITLLEDGTGTVVSGKNSYALTWKALDGQSIRLVAEGDGGESTATLSDGALVLKSDGSMYVPSFTKDGVFTGEAPQVTDEGSAITTAEGLVGTWQCYAMKNSDHGNFFAFGKAEDLAKVTGFDSGEMVLNEDGTATLLGYEATWSASENGASVVVKLTSVDCPLLATSDGVVCQSSVDGARYWFKK